MINCLYHAKLPLQIVDCHERKRLLASGEWFDSEVEALADYHAKRKKKPTVKMEKSHEAPQNAS